MARAKKNALQVDFKIPTDKEIEKMFGSVSLLKRFSVTRKAVKASSKIVEKRARSLAPRSTQADRNRRSKRQKESADWETIPMHTTISHVVRDYQNGSAGFVGPEYPHGNKAYFNQPVNRKRKHVLWGRDVGRIYVATRNWIVQAFDETKAEQLSAMKASLQKSIDSMMKDN